MFSDDEAWLRGQQMIANNWQCVPQKSKVRLISCRRNGMFSANWVSVTAREEELFRLQETADCETEVQENR
jgi:hypothetical protein